MDNVTPKSFLRLAKGVGFRLFVRCVLTGIFLAMVIVLPVVAFVLIGHWIVFCLWPILFFAWRAFVRGGSHIHKSCPECGGEIVVQSGGPGGEQTFVVCRKCGLSADTGLRPGEPA